MAANTENKVEFGISQLHIGTYTEENGSITFGTPVAVPGARNLSLEPQSDEVKFYADNVIYYGAYTDNGFTGTLEVARFPEAFKKAFMGYVDLADGGLGKKKGVSKPNVYISFQAEGDQSARRVILYNVALGEINREYATKEESVEPATETIDISVMGINAGDLQLTKASYKPGTNGYDAVFTAPTVPALKTT